MHFNALIPELAVTDCAKSLAFYCDILGFGIAYQRAEEGFAFLTFGEAQLMLDQADVGRTFSADGGVLERPFGRGQNLQISAKSIDSLVAALAKNKIELTLAPEEKWYRQDGHELGVRQFVVADPDGYLLRFSQSLGQRKG